MMLSSEGLETLLVRLVEKTTRDTHCLAIAQQETPPVGAQGIADALSACRISFANDELSWVIPAAYDHLVIALSTRLSDFIAEELEVSCRVAGCETLTKDNTWIAGVLPDATT